MSLPQPAIPSGQRLYTIGDIHGRADLLTALLKKIDEDAGETPRRIVFLGDYVDRGLYSKQVIDKLIELKTTEKLTPIYMLGNHEQVMRELLRGREDNLLNDWLRFGGKETLMSYGVNPTAGADKVISSLKEKVPPAHVEFLEKLETSATVGDYFFCHAGVRPGVELNAQTEQDLVWIRYDFLAAKEPHGKMIVHGHTISASAEFKPNRINIDTGAYATGCLTALGLEGTKQWLLQTK
jgi:serine/threonine protein phosphatase 1